MRPGLSMVTALAVFLVSWMAAAGKADHAVIRFVRIEPYGWLFCAVGAVFLAGGGLLLWRALMTESKGRIVAGALLVLLSMVGFASASLFGDVGAFESPSTDMLNRR